MLIPNIVVSDVAASVRFYVDVLGMEIVFAVDPEHNTTFDDSALDRAAFASVKRDDSELMIQSVRSLNEELPEQFPLDHVPRPGGTMYLRGVDPREVVSRVPEGQVIMVPRKSWYGMMEMYVSDADGHLVCVGIAEGEGPEA